MHDNTVYAYGVDCAGRRIVLHTEHANAGQREFTDIIFSEVTAHHLEHVLPGNILFDIEEVDVAALVRENNALLADSWRWGWPPVEYDGDLDALVATLTASGIRAYEISASYGMSGWILARGCQRVRRAERARME